MHAITSEVLRKLDVICVPSQSIMVADIPRQRVKLGRERCRDCCWRRDVSEGADRFHSLDDPLHRHTISRKQYTQEKLDATKRGLQSHWGLLLQQATA